MPSAHRVLPTHDVVGRFYVNGQRLADRFCLLSDMHVDWQHYKQCHKFNPNADVTPFSNPDPEKTVPRQAADFQSVYWLQNQKFDKKPHRSSGYHVPCLPDYMRQYAESPKSP